MWGWSLGRTSNLISALLPPTLQSRSEKEPRMNLRAYRDVKNPSLSPSFCRGGEGGQKETVTGLMSHRS